MMIKLPVIEKRKTFYLQTARNLFAGLKQLSRFEIIFRYGIVKQILPSNHTLKSQN